MSSLKSLEHPDHSGCHFKKLMFASVLNLDEGTGTSSHEDTLNRGMGAPKFMGVKRRGSDLGGMKVHGC
jgi:hypothetical protein